MTINKLEVIPVELEVKLQLARILSELHNGDFGSAIEFFEQCFRGRAAVKSRIVSGDEVVNNNCYRYSLMLEEMESLVQIFCRLAKRGHPLQERRERRSEA